MRDAVLEAARFLAAGRTRQLTLEDVADHVRYSPFHLARAFEREIGLPPGKFLAAQRFQLAKELLLDTGEKVVGHRDQRLDAAEVIDLITTVRRAREATDRPTAL
ncbi:helix-turn-helix domain-containing protein, partial [Amycolatopsis sp. NPDC000673]|uniref:helix-turn-helix domain-containing protein n=1 Tax=Amycolatopsis sp. NPDC000673 TaxID=3154267 RepID=UPI00332AF61C